jgi:hypothetical protein
MPDLVLERVYAAAANRDARLKIDSFCKPGAVYHKYYAESVKDRLSDLQKEECDKGVIKSKKEVDEKYKEVYAAQKELIRELQEGHKNTGQVYKGMFQQARDRIDSYQMRENAYEKHINGRLDHVARMEELMFDEDEVMEKKRMELAYDTVAQAVADEATAFINKRKNKRKLKRGGDRRSAKWHVTTFAWNQVKMCETTDPGMINASLAMSIATHVAHMPVKKSFSDYDWELSKQ